MRVLGHEPNTVVELPGLGFLVLNEQVRDPPAPGHTGLTLRALRLVLTAPGLDADAELVVREAHSDATRR